MKVSSRLTPPDLCYGFYATLITDRETIDSLHEKHYEFMNGGEVDDFLTAVYNDNTSFEYTCIYTLQMTFAYPLPPSEADEILNPLMEDMSGCIYIFIPYKALTHLSKVETYNVVYSYEGLKSKTKSAAKITQT